MSSPSHKILFFFLLAAIAGCDALEFSPNQRFDHDTAKDLNAKNLKKLQEAPVDDTITIAFVGDSQRFYDEVKDFVRVVNTYQSVDFILLAGDITDFGLLQEYEWTNNLFEKTNKPIISVIGNHDIIANGDKIFKRMFGELNYTFIYDSVKFIIHNTNSREYKGDNVPDLTWLEEALQDDAAVKYYIPVSHVPPFDHDFNADLIDGYTSLIRERSNLLLSLHGHIHRHEDFYPYQDGVRYLTSYSFDKRGFVLLKIVRGEVFKTLVPY